GERRVILTCTFPPPHPELQESIQYRFVHAREVVQFAQRYVFVDLVDAGVARPEFDDLGAGGCDEAAVAGAAGGGELRADAAHALDGAAYGFGKGTGGSQEGIAGELPLHAVVAVMAVEDLVDAALQLFRGGFRGEAEIEQYVQFGGYDVVGAGAGVNVRALEARGREVVVAAVTLHLAEFGEGGHEAVDGVDRQVRIGHVSQLALHLEYAVEGAA